VFLRNIFKENDFNFYIQGSISMLKSEALEILQLLFGALAIMNKCEPFSEKLLEQIRSKFAYVESDPIGGRRIYFENAGGSLTLKSVLKVLPEVAALPDNAGRQNDASNHIDQIIKKGIEDVKILLNAKNGSILAGESTTSNIFRIMEVFTSARKGTNIVCTNLDHASLFDATRFFAEKLNIEMRVAKLDTATGAVPCEAITSLVDENTVAVGFIHASNVTGVKNDAKKIVTEIRKKYPDVFILADGAQHAQHCAVDVTELGVDAYLVAAYKLFSKVGLTFAYISPRVAELPHWKLRGKPLDNWDLGTRDASGYASISAAVDYLCWLGKQINPQIEDKRTFIVTAMEAIESHEMALTDRLFNGNSQLPGILQMDGISVYGYPVVTEDREAVFAINLDGLPAKEFVKRCVAAGIIVHDRQSDAYTKHTLQAMSVDQCVRVSLAHYNSSDEVDAFLRLTESLCHEVKNQGA